MAAEHSLKLIASLVYATLIVVWAGAESTNAAVSTFCQRLFFSSEERHRLTKINGSNIRFKVTAGILALLAMGSDITGSVSAIAFWREATHHVVRPRAEAYNIVSTFVAIAPGGSLTDTIGLCCVS